MLITAKLQLAAARMGGPDFSVWPAFDTTGSAPSMTDLAQGNLAAHYLISSPFGTETRLDPKDGGSVYLDAFNDAQEAVVPKFLVAQIGG